MAALQEDKYSFPKEMGKDPEPGRGLIVIILVCVLIMVASYALIGTPLGAWILLGFQKPS